MAGNTPNLVEIVAGMHSKPEPQSSMGPVPPTSSIQAALQTAMSKKLAEAQAAFDAEVRGIIEDANRVQQSDLVTVKLANGEEAIWAPGEKASLQELLNWLATNGWEPIGI